MLNVSDHLLFLISAVNLNINIAIRHPLAYRNPSAWQLVSVTYRFIVLSITQSTKDFITQFVELVRANNPAPVQRMSVQEITGEVSTTTSAQESATNVDAVADDLRDRIDTASSVVQAKAIRVDIESQKVLLGTALYTELKNKAVKRYYQVDAQNKVGAVINSLPNPGEPEATAMFAKAESTLTAAKRHLGDELYDQFRITLDDMKPEYVC